MKKNLLHRSLSTSSGGSSSSGSSGSYTVDLNGEWELSSSVPNPNINLYDGVYENIVSHDTENAPATMRITIKDCDSFRLYIRTCAYPVANYIMVSHLDQNISLFTSYSNSSLVKAHTRPYTSLDTTIDSYILVEFTEIPPGEHVITIIYKKEAGYTDLALDKGYVLIQKVNTEPEERKLISDIQIYIVDSNMTLWEVESFPSNLTAIGVGLVTDDHKFIISKTQLGKSQWCGYDDPDILPDYRTIDGINTEGCLPGLDGNYSINNTARISGNYATWIAGAITDFEGKTNTQLISSECPELDLWDNLKNFNNSGNNGGFNDWYVPSVGLMALICIANNLINEAFNIILGSTLDGSYWTSTENKAGYPYLSYLNARSFNDTSGSVARCKVLLIRDLIN